MSGFVLDASLALQWFLVDETDRKYSLTVLSRLSQERAVVPVLWYYEVGNGLLMAHRRKRVTLGQMGGFLTRLRDLPIDLVLQTAEELLELPNLALSHGLTNYDAAYLELAMRAKIPVATTDIDLRQAASRVGVAII